MRPRHSDTDPESAEHSCCLQNDRERALIGEAKILRSQVAALLPALKDALPIIKRSPGIVGPLVQRIDAAIAAAEGK
jgi:hypothetical protein